MTVILLESSLKPLNIYRSFVGLAPFSKNLPWIALLRTCFFLVVYLYISINSFMELFDDEDDNENIFILTKLTSAVALQLPWIITVAIILLEYINRRKIARVLANVKEIDKMLSRNHQDLNISVNNKTTAVFVYVMVSVAVVILSTPPIVFLYYFHEIGFLVIITLTIEYHFSFAVNIAMILQISVFLFILKQRFIWINQILKTFGERLIDNDISSSRLEHSNQLPKLELLRSIYTKLIETFIAINQSYSAAINLFILEAIAVIVSFCYIIGLFLPPLEGYTISFFISALIPISYNTYALILLGLSYQSINKETALTVHLLHMVQGRYESPMKNAVKLWSLQILNSKSGYYGGGFFRMTLLFSIFGSIVSYLIFLIQFKNMTENQ